MKKKPSENYISLRKHRQETARLQAQIDGLRSDLGQAIFESGKHVQALHKVIDVTDENRHSLADTRADVFYLKSRLDRLERRIVGFLDKEQLSFIEVMGCDKVEYGINYMKHLHSNRHIIAAARNIQ